MTRFLYLSTLLLFSFTIFAQPTTGLRFDPISFDSIPGIPTYTGTKEIVSLPKAVDLTGYCPTPIDQGNDQTCVAFATAYAAYATQQAAALSIKSSPQEITYRFALSPVFPLLKLKHPCWEAINLQAIGKFMTQNESLRFRDYRVLACKTPSIPKAQLAPPIRDILRLFSQDNAPEEKIRLTKSQLNHRHPVIVGLTVYKNFFNLNTALYQPSAHSKETGIPHAMVVIAYDDDREAFKIMNSFGPTWGEKGFFWIKYQDFSRDAVAAFTLALTETEVVAGAGKPMRLGGQFGIRAIYEEADTIRYDTLHMQHIGQGVYQPTRQIWPVGQAFQLLTENTQPDEYMCVFSVDATYKLTVHFPRNRALMVYNPVLVNKNESDLLPFDGFDAVIPDQETALTLEQPGTDYLCVLYSSRPLLPDLPTILSKLNTLGTIRQRLNFALGKRLLSVGVNYNPQKMQFTTQFRPEKEADTVVLVFALRSIDK